MFIYDERGDFIKGETERNKGDTILFSRNLEKGTYFVKITPFDWSRITSASYRLKATFSDNTVFYADLETDQDWSENIFWALDKKLISDYKNILNKKTGKKENLLKPYDKLTEAQFLTVLSRYGKPAEQYKTKSTANKQITRGKMAEILVSIHLGKKVSEKEAVHFFIKNGFTTAKTTKEFKSSAGLTRAEIVTFMKKYDTFLNK